MPRFEPFRGLRYRSAPDEDITRLTSPPYDVFDEAEREALAIRDAHNIVRVDYPVESDGPDRYELAAETLDQWRRAGILIREDKPSFYVYRLSFTDEKGIERRTVGVVGGLEVTPEGSPEVLPHERTTPKAKTDRLDLTRATRCNLSSVWGLSLSEGLSGLLAQPGTPVAHCTDERGVRHVLERIDEPARVQSIANCVESNPVLIADGHHRYAISRTYLAERRGSGSAGGAELTMTFIQELVSEQLSVAAIHRLYDRDASELWAHLRVNYEVLGDCRVDQTTLRSMEELGALCLVDSAGRGQLIRPREDTFNGVRALDSARLEHSLRNLEHNVAYQHGLTEVIGRVGRDGIRAAVLIRPVSIDEIRRTAETGELMPPKSTFFTPKLRTGLVLRPIE